MKRSLLLIIFFLSLKTVSSQNFTVDNVNYNITNIVTKTVEVTTTCYTGNLIIPSTVLYSGITYTVTSIGGYAFRLCPNIRSVTIPTSVASIGVYAFANSELTSISIPDSVTYIGNNAFQYCASLSSISLPNLITSIAAYTFSNSAITTVNIPDSITYIGDNAFQACTNLNSVNVNIITPLLINTTIFSGVTISSVALNVPNGSVTNYEAANIWKDFNPINGTLNTLENTLSTGIKLYPNPVKNTLFIKEKTGNGLQGISIFNLQGKNFLTSTKDQIDVSTLQTGIYVAQIKNKEMEMFVKFIKD
jgi:hypothetical protein